MYKRQRRFQVVFYEIFPLIGVAFTGALGNMAVSYTHLGWYYNNQRIKILLDSEQAVVYTDEENGVCVTISRDGNHQISEIKEISETDAQSLMLKNNPIGEDYTSQE